MISLVVRAQDWTAAERALGAKAHPSNDASPCRTIRRGKHRPRISTKSLFMSAPFGCSVAAAYGAKDHRCGRQLATITDCLVTSWSIASRCATICAQMAQRADFAKTDRREKLIDRDDIALIASMCSKTTTRRAHDPRRKSIKVWRDNLSESERAKINHPKREHPQGAWGAFLGTHPESAGSKKYAR